MKEKKQKKQLEYFRKLCSDKKIKGCKIQHCKEYYYYKIKKK